ncbi:MAG: methionyl-tRNA formyltransferase [Marinicellaceae bacterium]
MRIVFCGTPEFSVEPLKQLIQHKHQVVAVYTQPDRGVGRGRKIQFSAVKQCALDNQIEVLQPQSLKNEEAINTLKDLKPDLLVVVAYGLILPQSVLDIPTLGCWNIHASLLPRWRGAAPIHRAILAGDKTTGVGIMNMEAGLDTGAVYVQHECAIGENETAQSLHDKLAKMGAHALIESLDLLHNNLLPEPMIQDEKDVTYAHKLKKSESKICWDESAIQIDRKIRALNPWPGVVANIEGIDFKLWRSQVIHIDTSFEPGTIVQANKNTLIIACHKGQLQIKSIQKPGKKQVSIDQFMPSMRHWYK